MGRGLSPAGIPWIEAPADVRSRATTRGTTPAPVIGPERAILASLVLPGKANLLVRCCFGQVVLARRTTAVDERNASEVAVRDLVAAD